MSYLCIVFIKLLFVFYCHGEPGQGNRYSDSLRVVRSGDRIPVRTRFSAPVQTCLGAHLASYTMCTISSLGVKRPGRRVDHPPPPSAEVKESVELYLYSTSGPSWPVKGCTLPLLLLPLFYCHDSFFTVPIVI